MAVTETVKIVFQVDDQPIVDTVAELQKLGKVSQEDAAKFNQLNQASKAAGASLEGASKGAEKFAVASKDVAKSTTEVAKSATELKTIAPTLASAGQAGEDAAEGFIPLRKRLAEAKLEAQQLLEELGPDNPLAQAAQNTAGELADEFDDFNRQIRLLNPEGKIQAFQNFGQGVLGAFGVATGALQAFGAENEAVAQIALRLQGALNIASGIQSIVGLKEAYEDVKVVLGLTTTAQNTLTGATNAGAAASTGAAGAVRTLTAALASNPFTAIAVAVGALAGALILLNQSTEQYALSEQQLTDIKDASKKATDDLSDAENQLAIKRGEKSKQAVETEKLIKSISEQIGQARVREIAAEKALADAQSNYNLRIKAAIADNRQEEIDFITTRLNNAQKVKDIASKEISDLRAQFNAKKALIDLDEQDVQNREKEAKDKDKLAEAEQAKQAQEQKSNEIINKRLAILSEEQKQRAFSIELNKLYGATEEDILQQKLFNNQADQEALDAILAKAQGTSQYDSVQSQLNEKVREEILLRKQLGDALEIPLLPLKNQLKSQEAINEELEKTGPIAVKVNTQWKGSAQELIDDQEKIAKNEQERVDRSFQIANQVADIFIEANQRQYEEEIAALEESKEKGLITEEQYEARLKKLKQKAAEDNKKAQVFQATMSAAQAILSALTIVADPATKAAAVAFAATVGALNLAKVIATPIPKFKKGTLAVPGHDTGEDSVMAMLRPGEAVIPTEINREYAPIIRAIYRKEVSSKEMNEFITSRDKSESSDTRKDLSIEDIKRFVSSYQSERNASIKELSIQDIKRFVSSYINESQDTLSELSIQDIKRFVSSYINERQNTSKQLTIQDIERLTNLQSSSTSKHLSTKDISEFINSRKNISYEEFSEVMRSKNSHLVTTKTIDVEPILKFDQVSLDALFKRDIKVSRINSTVNNTSAAAMPSINVKADVDTYALSRAMAKNKSMELSNPDIVAKALAQELSKLDNPRRR